MATANITDDSDGFGVLSGAHSITTTQIGNSHYALVASYWNDDGVQIIDITNPASPVATANITDGSGGFDTLFESRSVTTTQIGNSHYALVASSGDHGVQIIDITNPASPVATASITDDSGGFGELNGAYSVTTTQIGNSHYALVASNGDHGVQIIDITNPASPVATANITDGSGGFDTLSGPRSVTTTQIGSSHYALVASSGDHGVQVIDITNPAYPINPLLPFIALDTTPPARAVYKELASDTLIFEYDVRKYDYSPRLAYTGTDAFHVNSYTLTDGNGTSIPTALPQPGSIGSLSYNKAIQIGLTPPNHINPVIHNTGAVTVSQGATFVSSVTCTDDVDNPKNILPDAAVDTSELGTQTVAYTCADSSGNTVTATQSVRVTHDRTLPTIVIPSDNPLTITEGDPYSDPVATCTDDVDASPTLTTSGTVNSTTPSTYTVTYTCTDRSNTATAILKVIVKIDVAPYVDSIETREPDTIIVTMSENVQSVTTTTGFTISGIVSDSSIFISSVTSLYDIITLSLSGGMLDSDSPRLAYNDTTGSITDLRGKSLARFDEAVKNTLDTTAPTVRSVTIDNSGTVYVRLSEVVFEDPVNGPGVFTTSNSSITVSPAVVSGSTITLDTRLGDIPDDDRPDAQLFWWCGKDCRRKGQLSGQL